MENMSIEKQDVTDSAVSVVKVRYHHDSIDSHDLILQTVQRLNFSKNFKQRNFTLNHLVDIWRGSKNQKIVTTGWNSDPLYGKASHLKALEANRIIKMLILEQYLWEELVVNKDCGASAYVRIGPKGTKLLSGNLKTSLSFSI